MASAGECAALPESCLKSIAVELLGWSPSCFTQLLNLSPRLHEQTAFGVLSFDEFIGKIIHVHSDSPGSIVTWIAAAPRSSIITLDPGTYDVTEQLVIDKPVIIHGASNVRYAANDFDRNAPMVIFRCYSNDSLILFAGDCDGAKIRNITIDTVSCPVTCSAGSPQIENCNIFSDVCFHICGHSKPAIRDCWIHGDNLDLGTFGIEVVGHAAPVIMHNCFNSFEEAAIIMCEQASGVVQGNHIEVPGWPDSATAFSITFQGSRPPQVFDNTVVNLRHTVVNLRHDFEDDEEDDEEGPADG